MITRELLDDDNWKRTLGEDDLDTTNFISSLYVSDNLDISDAESYLKNYVTVNSTIEELALKYIAHNFQYFKETNDTIIIGLGFDNVYCKILEHSTFGHYALLKELVTPYTDDWEFKQIRTFSPYNDSFNGQDCWMSKRLGVSLESETSARMLATIICDKFDKSIASLYKLLNDVLERDSLAVFFDVEAIEELFGYDDLRDLKRIFL